MRSAQQTKNVLDKLAKNLSTIITSNKVASLDEDSCNGKYKRTYNQNEACIATGTHAKKITKLCETLAIDYKDGAKWCIDFDDILTIRHHLGHEVFKEKYPDAELHVWCVSSLKGGGGKTTSTVTIASGLAYECLTRYRVGIIDLDPQGTATMLIKPNFSDNDISVGDILLDNVEPDAGESFESLCSSAFYPTNNPNLRIMCAREDDREYEVYVTKKEIEANANGKPYLSYTKLESIIEAVKDEFDIIFIDTPPQFSPQTLAGHFVANHLLVPMKPSENDKDSSAKYADFLAKMYRLVAGMGHDGYHSIKAVITSLKKSSVAQQRIAHNIRVACAETMMINEMIESDAVTNCGEDFCTVYDQSASEYSASKSSLRAAQQEYRLIVDEIERIVLTNTGADNG